MSNFEQLLNSILETVDEATTVTPTRPATPAAPSTPKKSPNPFRRPGHNPFQKPKPKAVDSEDRMVNFFQKRLKNIKDVFDKYTK